MHAAKSKAILGPGPLPHLPQKPSPLETLAVGVGTPTVLQKAIMFESRTCKELMSERLNRVRLVH
jgi:hypothetical protein